MERERGGGEWDVPQSPTIRRSQQKHRVHRIHTHATNLRRTQLIPPSFALPSLVVLSEIEMRDAPRAVGEPYFVSGGREVEGLDVEVFGVD